MKPRILFVEPQEDIDDISRKIATLGSETVFLVVPIQAVLFQSIISVKILSLNTERAGKILLIVTRDPTGISFCERLNIAHAPDLEHLEELPIERTLRERKEKQENSKPIRVRSFSKEHQKKAERVSSLREVEQKRREILELLSRPNRTLLFIIGGISFALFLFITTLTLPGATILISPQKKIIEVTTNITLVPELSENTTDSWRQQTVPFTPIESIFEKNIPFETVTSIFTGKSASGTLRVMNTLSEEISLRPGTRFQTSDGVIFRSESWLRLRPNQEVNIPVVADERDTFGSYIGDKGNIQPPQKLIIPGLPSPTREHVWGEISEPFTGGVDGFVPVVSEEDLDLARRQIQEMILRDAKKDSDIFVERKNRLENTDLVLLPGQEFLETEVLEIDLPEEMIGKNVSRFPVRSRMRVRMVAFSKSDVVSILREALEKIVDPGMHLASLETESIFPEVLSVSPKKDRIKVTVSVRGVEQYLIEPSTVDGVRFVNRLKAEVQGRSIPEAKRILENFQEVAVVNISLWPPFFGRIPRLPENISVKLMEQ